MSSDFEVRGADQFLRLSKALKDAGRSGMRKELHKGLRDAVNRVKPEAADALSAALPSGLRAKGKKVKQAVQVKTGSNPGVSVAVRYGRAGTGIGASNAKRLNQSGSFRHPVYGSGRWVSQSRPAATGWFDKTYTNKAPQLRADLERVLRRIADDIVWRGR
jgi:hypothetical protein